MTNIDILRGIAALGMLFASGYLAGRWHQHRLTPKVVLTVKHTGTSAVQREVDRLNSELLDWMAQLPEAGITQEEAHRLYNEKRQYIEIVRHSDDK